ncbi:hypothetical protein ACNFU2_03365 [Chryseobacterium sp. PTM-20240506]|uniref:hypothetical protein n=1 Tax=Chryseobacterium sp. PTM-20240506 TaxID=3400631 RepID=UPI003AAAC6A8
MKKSGILIAFIVGAAMIHAQKIQTKDVPVQVQSSFTRKFPDAHHVKWEKEKGKFEAGFTSKGTSYSALLDATGNIIETEKLINPQSLSTPIKQFIIKKYPESSIKEAAQITDSKGVVTYEAEVNGMDIIFDANGKFLKEIKD